MDILYTVEEKYLQAVDELNYGESPKAFRLFNEIIQADPEYARAYYQLGCFYHYQFRNYQAAGYYYKKCVELDAAFPDVYERYLSLLISLKMERTIRQLADKALEVPGVCRANIYESLGLHAEALFEFTQAKAYYKLAALSNVNQTEHSTFRDHLKRIGEKQNGNGKIIYAYQEG